MPTFCYFNCLECHSTKCHRPRTSSCHNEQRGGTDKTLFEQHNNQRKVFKPTQIWCPLVLYPAGQTMLVLLLLLRGWAMASCSKVSGVPFWIAVAVGTAVVGAAAAAAAFVVCASAAVLLVGAVFAAAAAADCRTAAAVVLCSVAAAALALRPLFFFCLFPVRATPCLWASSSVSSTKFAALLSCGSLFLWYTLRLPVGLPSSVKLKSGTQQWATTFLSASLRCLLLLCCSCRFFSINLTYMWGSPGLGDASAGLAFWLHLFLTSPDLLHSYIVWKGRHSSCGSRNSIHVLFLSAWHMFGHTGTSAGRVYDSASVYT